MLSNTRVTSANEWGPRVSDPLKITSSIALPRRWRADCSPIAQRMASTMFDLPQPFGPTIALTSWSMWTTVRSTNDLKPQTSTFLIFIERAPWSWPAQRRRTEDGAITGDPRLQRSSRAFVGATE